MTRFCVLGLVILAVLAGMFFFTFSGTGGAAPHAVTASTTTFVPHPPKPGIQFCDEPPRWDVKTGQDAGAGRIDLSTAKVVTVGYMTNLAPHYHLPNGYRLAPLETTQLQITATIVFVQPEADGDYHIVLQDSTSPNVMITELPDPACIPATDPWQAQIAQARAVFTAHLATAVGSTVTIRGPGFFDTNGLTNESHVAPNDVGVSPRPRHRLPVAPAAPGPASDRGLSDGSQ